MCDDGIEAAVAPVRHAHDRIFQTVGWSRNATEAWDVLNKQFLAGQVLHTPLRDAALTIRRGLLTDRIVTATRVLDGVRADRLSFPIVKEILDTPGIMDRFEEEAERFWEIFNGTPRDAVRARHQIFVDRLAATLIDPRYLRVKGFRHENVAHELLQGAGGEPPPQHRELRWLMETVMKLTEDVAVIINGHTIHWDVGDVTRSSEALWSAIVDRYPTEIDDQHDQ